MNATADSSALLLPEVRLASHTDRKGCVTAPNTAALDSEFKGDNLKMMVGRV